MKTISLKVPETLDEELGRRATSRGVSKSDLVREAVAAYLVDDTPPPATGFLSAAGDLVGCIDGGPKDLSYNPEHLAGYGK
jgi:hypothetical protein